MGSPLQRLGQIHDQLRDFAAQFKEDPRQISSENVDGAIKELEKVIKKPPHQFISDASNQSKSTRKLLREIGSYVRVLDPDQFNKIQVAISRLNHDLYKLPRGYEHFMDRLQFYQHVVKAGITNKNIKEIARFLRDGFCFFRGISLDGSQLNDKQQLKLENALRDLQAEVVKASSKENALSDEADYKKLLKLINNLFHKPRFPSE